MQNGFEKEWLNEEYRRRRSANPHYSLRSFSRAVQIYPGRLSEYLSGKRKISTKMAKKIALRLGVPSEKLELMFASGTADNASPFMTLEADAFSALADWQHFAILSLMETKSFQPDERWIARRLGISIIEARSALDRLLRLNLATRKGKKIRPTQKGLTTTHDIESSALKKSHSQSLEQAITALEEVPVDLRDITSVTMAIDLRKLPLAKKVIRNFRRQLMAVLENESADEVYNLNVQLVPLTKVSKGPKK